MFITRSAAPVRGVSVVLFLPILLLLPALSAEAGQRHATVDRALRESVQAGATTQKIIITVNPGCRAAVREALQSHGDVVSSEQTLIDAVSGEVHSRDVDELAKSPCVKGMSSDAAVFAIGARRDDDHDDGKSAKKSGGALGPLTSTLRDTLGLPHYAALDPSVPTGASGVVVALIDSGIEPSASFGSRITAFYDFTRGRPRAAAPYDDYGHGTHLAGLIGSSGRLSNYEFQGVAPNVSFVGLKVLDKTGAGRTSDVINAIEFVIANRARLNVQVINLSLGHPIYAPAEDDPLVQAVEQAAAAGIVVVTSSGNNGQKADGTSGYAGITSPGNAPSAITVGAVKSQDTTTRLDDVVAEYSSRGPTWFDGLVKPDVVAPGHRLASDANPSSYLYGQLEKNRGQSKSGQPLLYLSGSSMSTAVATGVVALVIDAHNTSPYRRQAALTPNLVKGILQYSAITIDGADYLTEGAGQVNAAGAIALGAGIDTSKPIGSSWLKRVSPHSVIGGVNYFWSRHIIYGDRVLRGDLLSANNIVWSSNIVWGTIDRNGENIVWGTADVEEDHVVWSTAQRDDENIVWGTNIVWGSRIIGQRVGGSTVVWGANIVWGAGIDWGTLESANIVWGTIENDGENIVWGTRFGGDVVWGTTGVSGLAGLVVRTWSFAELERERDFENIVWGTGGVR